MSTVKPKPHLRLHVCPQAQWYCVTDGTRTTSWERAPFAAILLARYVWAPRR